MVKKMVREKDEKGKEEYTTKAVWKRATHQSGVDKDRKVEKARGEQ